MPRLFALLVALLGLPAAAPGPKPGTIRVRLETAAGPITLALDGKRAPVTTANFLRYVDDGRFDGVSFYRVARHKRDPRFGFVQSGIRTDARRYLRAIPHESTRKTGIRHLDMTISMARMGDPGSANGNFFITVGAAPWMDWSPSNAGYAAFGRVIAGRSAVRRILAMPTTAAMKGTLLRERVRVNRAVRLDGRARPTGLPRPWLIEGLRDG